MYLRGPALNTWAYRGGVHANLFHVKLAFFRNPCYTMRICSCLNRLLTGDWLYANTEQWEWR